MAYFDQPIQFIAYNSLSKKLEITEESKLFFSSIKGEHISVIVIVGAYRTGKSFLLNRLRGSQKVRSDISEISENMIVGIRVRRFCLWMYERNLDLGKAHRKSRENLFVDGH